MEKVSNTVQIYAQVFTFLGIWFAVIIITGLFSPVDLWTALKMIPTAVTVYAFVGFVFTKWIWRWKVFQGWLIKIPDLQGTWRGELQSDWINPATGKGIPPVPVMLVIRQTFSALKCTLMTAESTSYSTTADINTATNGEDLYLTYNYTNKPKALIRDRSAIHDGAAMLRIIRQPGRCLEGEYWTSRKTRGDISLQFHSHVLTEKFS